ncbi:protein DA1-related 2 isoform X5 [Syzygium oleosum]|uniref:protein DA1-related 2 isoform X5 n=1 Tax=Syzygium oleosum TaxID=219896 RepID=UPI0024B898DB|nr:protein DA1-related 2 isoform X5 [Syzygium oleosum]
MAPPSSSVNHLSQPCIYAGDFVSSYAERKSRFMRWLGKLFKSGSGRGGSSRCPQYLGDENMVWRAPARSVDDHSRGDKEKEDLDRAVALSLAEDLRRQNGSDPYHQSCFKELTHPKCEVCHQFIPTNGAGLIEYRCHPFWSQKYCPSHEHDNTARCCSCERLESWNPTYISLGDGRSLCLECMESAIMDTGDCQSLYHAIRDYYEGMNMKLDQQIPMLLVERQALNEAIVGEKNGHHHMPETRGLCLSEEQTVSSVHRRPRVGGHRLVGMRTQPQKLTRKCEVTAILVLYGLPRLLTGAILAHELMHGWLRLKGYRNLNPEVEEGICQVLSYMWLESEVVPEYRSAPSTSAASSSSTSSKKGGKSEVEKKLGKFFMHQIANDTSLAYGGGFRAANAAVNKYGLRRTLDHIKLTGLFP